MATSRLNLQTPVGTDLVSPVEAISDQMEIIDESINTVICTSITRPLIVFPGMEIFETDTNMMYFWTGSTWQHISDSTTTSPASANSVIGRIAFVVGNWTDAFPSDTGVETGPAMTFQANLIKGRKYRLFARWNVRIGVGGPSDVLPADVILRRNEGPTVDTSSTLCTTGSSDFLGVIGSATGSVAHHTVVVFDIAGSGVAQFTFGMFLKKKDDTAPGAIIDFNPSNTTYSYMALEDVGGI